MSEQEWIGQQWPTDEKVRLRKVVVQLIEAGWREANLTLFTRAAVASAIDQVEHKGLDAEVVRRGMKL